MKRKYNSNSTNTDTLTIINMIWDLEPILWWLETF